MLIVLGLVLVVGFVRFDGDLWFTDVVVSWWLWFLFLTAWWREVLWGCGLAASGFVCWFGYSMRCGFVVVIVICFLVDVCCYCSVCLLCFELFAWCLVRAV